MKKHILIFAAALICLFLCACGNWEIEIRNPYDSSEESSESESSESDSSESSEESSAPERESESSSESEPEPEQEVDFPPIEGDFMLLETKKDFTVMENAVLEFEDRIFVYSVGGELAGFDKESGEKVYSAMPGNANDIGFVAMTKTDDIEGFDICIYTIENVLYYSSIDEEKTFSKPLPKEVTETNMFGGITGKFYGIDEERIIWQSKEGIMMIPKEGGEAKLILDNSDIERDIVSIAEKPFENNFSGNNGGPYIYLAPEFICGGTKIVVTVTSWDYVYWASALYNLETGKFEWAYCFGEQDGIQYPVCDRYVIIRTSAGVKFIDAQIGESENLERFAGWAFADGEDIHFALLQWNNGGGNFEINISNDTIKDDSDIVLVAVTDPATSGNIHGFTENYVIFTIFNGENEWICATRFTELE